MLSEKDKIMTEKANDLMNSFSDRKVPKEVLSDVVTKRIVKHTSDITFALLKVLIDKKIITAEEINTAILKSEQDRDERVRFLGELEKGI